jgi:hypothetical protein
MAIFHLNARPIQRRKGGTASGLGAYMLDAEIVDPYDGRRHRQRGRHCHDITAMTFFPGVEDFFHTPMAAFRSIDAFEKRKDATLGSEVEVALPHELDRWQQIAVVANFAAAIADRDGRYVVACIHHKEGNEHCHLWISDRPVGRDESGNVLWGKKDNTPKANQERLLFYRETWAEVANDALGAAGSSARIDHRSHSERGITQTPFRHEGKTPSPEALAHNEVVRADRELTAAVQQQRANGAAMIQVRSELTQIDTDIHRVRAKLREIAQKHRPRQQIAFHVSLSVGECMKKRASQETGMPSSSNEVRPPAPAIPTRRNDSLWHQALAKGLTEFDAACLVWSKGHSNEELLEMIGYDLKGDLQEQRRLRGQDWLTLPEPRVKPAPTPWDIGPS